MLSTSLVSSIIDAFVTSQLGSQMIHFCYVMSFDFYYTMMFGYDGCIGERSLNCCTKYVSHGSYLVLEDEYNIVVVPYLSCEVS